MLLDARGVVTMRCSCSARRHPRLIVATVADAAAAAAAGIVAVVLAAATIVAGSWV